MATTHEHMATTYHNAIQKLYIAYFNRPADYDGLNYWETRVEADNGNTAAVSAAFAASAEYKAEYGGMKEENVINQIYLNLFGRTAEPTGLVYWTKALESKAFTIDQAVTIIANAAQDTDKVAFDSKVAFASAFTAALDTPAEQTGYSGDLANDAVKEIVAGIKTATDLAKAIAPAALSASVSAVVKAATPFTLASGLAALEAAEEAKADFLDEVEEELEMDEDDIDNSIGDAEVALDALIPAAYVGATKAVKAAYLSDQVAKLADDLEDAQGDYDDALEAAAEVDGLTDAIADLTAAKTGLEALEKVQTNAEAAVAAAIASYNVKNSTALTVGVDGTVTGVIELDDGELVLADDITEKDNPGVTALLAATIAKEEADVNVAAAEDAVAGATLIVDVLDLDAGASELANVGAAMTIVEPKDVDAPTGQEIIDEVAALHALAVAARAASDAAPADVALDTAADEAEQAEIDFQALVDAFTAADGNPLVDAVDLAADAVKDAEEAVEDLDDAIADLEEATALTAELKALNDAIDAAQDAFIDAGLKAPVVLGAANSATSGSDIFVVDDDVMASTVVNFGQLGTDSLYIGADYVLNTTGKLDKGDNTKLEVFLIQSGSSVKVYLETEVYGSDTAAVAEQVITLTGITIAELTLANGIITAA